MILSLYTCVPYMTIIWCMVPEIFSATDQILCYFGPFFALLPSLKTKKSKFWKNEKNTTRYYHFTQVYHKWQSYDVLILRHEAWQTEFFVILDCFLPFYPPNSPKNQNFKKMKKIPRDIIILHICTKNYDQMMYHFWDMLHNGQTDGQTDRWTEKVTHRGGCPT